MKYVILKIDLGKGVYKAFPYIFSEHDTHSVSFALGLISLTILFC